MQYLAIFLAGFFGGVLRGLMGIAKSLVTKKEERINYRWFFLSIFIAGIVGLIAASFIGQDFRLAFLAGYAGSDFLETLYKIKIQKKLT
jgi:hypothetical protein